MLKVLIIEDETLAARRLQTLIHRYDPGIEVEAILPSIKAAADWLSRNLHPDLIFMDVHLEDGLSYSIFDRVALTCPVVFTTAFDEYALMTAPVSRTACLTKPVQAEELAKVIEHFR